ncbi:unnamed protein product [Coffea canephora]|uniref:DH200=94 genomic scaffold, scaffold_1511 n=1 Tax=Coffea canephora TaxID=49390 RepID=A0A068VJ76_COFCA|nr:unnamed protein product [Coffea canephora]
MGLGGFFMICILHSLVALSCGGVMMFHSYEFLEFSHGRDHASKFAGSTPHDQLLIRTSDSFSGLLLFAIGFLLVMVAFVKDRDFQSYFARRCVLLHSRPQFGEYTSRESLKSSTAAIGFKGFPNLDTKWSVSRFS